MSAAPEPTADTSLVQLGQALVRQGYRFVTPTPLTHEKYLARSGGRRAANVRDVLGWNLPFEANVLPAQHMTWLQHADALREVADAEAGATTSWRARLRFSSLGPLVLAHGAYPTTERDAVFFGPDTYRFAAFLRQHVRHARRAVDIGCGSGAGGLSLGARVETLVCADLSVSALRMSAVNARINRETPWGCPQHIAFCESDLYRDLSGQFDLIVANPPYIQDDTERLYRHGGNHMGTDLSVRIVREGLERLEPGGRLLLYTGSPVVDGVCIVEEAVRAVVAQAGAAWEVACDELDPDVFGEELGRACYAEAERLAVVGAVVTRKAR